MVAPARPSDRSQRGLDWLNFFMADVETAFGPFIAVYLSRHGWRQGDIGSILTVTPAVALITQLPAGALVDWTRRKRLVVAVCLVLIAGGALLIAFFPRFLPVMVAGVMHGVTGGAARIALTAIALGLVGHRTFHTRVGRNHLYASFGNAATAVLMGVMGSFCLSLIHDRDIDYARARSSEGRREPKPAQWRELAKNHRLLIFAFCLFLFQFANASLLPLAVERLKGHGQRESELVTAALVVVPQVFTALIAAFVARKADEWGRKPLLLAGFAVLPVQALSFAFAPGPWFLVGFDLFGGVTAVIIGIMTPLVVADVTRRSGRYNVALGASGMIGGVGATISTTAIGFFAQPLGFTVGFLALAVVAACGLAVVWLFLPETSYEAKRED